MTTETAPIVTRNRPNTGAALGYFLLGMPLAILWFTLLVTLLTVGVAASITWVGLPILAFAILLTRGIGRFEIGRANAMLGTRITPEYRAVRGIKARMTDPATWRGLGYTLSLLPITILEFAVVVGLWAAGLNYFAVPFYYWALPGGMWTFPTIGDGPHWFAVRSFTDGLPWMALGALLLTLAVLVTKGIAVWHARYARRILGESGRMDKNTQQNGEWG
ncbi:sensor domain-containing protein [Sciscionella marina]|uniref:sensor domain-containing protein n=1 Tax=Sciscionella marina TaxID=508770 RepID=UPI0003820CF3|nr:sensor domain-containing protein [Sciscionella marina]